MVWANIIADILIQLFWLNASKDFLIECLQKLYAKYAAFGYYPSLFDLYNYVKSLKIPVQSRLSRYQESLTNLLGGLIHSSLGPVLDCSRGHTQYLINHHVILEILYLSNDDFSIAIACVFILLLFSLFFTRTINRTVNSYKYRKYLFILSGFSTLVCLMLSIEYIKSLNKQYVYLFSFFVAGFVYFILMRDRKDVSTKDIKPLNNNHPGSPLDKYFGQSYI